jgi:hypothetical protein
MKAVGILRVIAEKSMEAMYTHAGYKLDIDDKDMQAERLDKSSRQEEQEEFLASSSLP